MHLRESKGNARDVMKGKMKWERLVEGCLGETALRKESRVDRALKSRE